MTSNITKGRSKDSLGYRMWVLQRAQAKLRETAQDSRGLELADAVDELHCGSGIPPWATSTTPRST